MKTLLTLFVLLFSSSVFGEDISDFQIEGMSIGDSLLDYFSEEEILKEIETNSEHYKYLNNTTKFGEVYIFNNDKFKKYTKVSFFVKPNDKKYKIFMIRGMLVFNENFEGCLKQQKELVSEIENLLTQFEKDEYDYLSPQDPSGKSTTHDIVFSFQTGDRITIQCDNWEENFRKKNNWTEGLSVAILTKEFNDWISDY